MAASGISISQEDLAFILEMNRIVSTKGSDLSLKEIREINVEYYSKKNGKIN